MPSRDLDGVDVIGCGDHSVGGAQPHGKTTPLLAIIAHSSGNMLDSKVAVKPVFATSVAFSNVAL